MNLQTNLVQPQDEQQEPGRQLQSWFLEFLKSKQEKQENKETRTIELQYKYQLKALTMIKEKTKTLEIDTNDLYEASPQNFQEIILSFHRYEPFLQKALAEFVAFLTESNNTQDHFGINQDNEQYFVSFYNYEQNRQKLRKLRLCNLGQLVSFNGTITKSTDVRPELIVGAFRCPLCNTINKGIEQEFKFTEPKLCKNPACKNSAVWQLEPNFSVFTDMQKLRVQEDSADIPPGGMPRSIDVILRDTICDRVKPGDKVKITGKLVAVPDIQSLTKPGEKNTLVSKGESIRTNNSISQDGITGLKQLGQRDLNYRLAFIGNSVVQISDGLQHKNNLELNEDEDEDEQNMSLDQIYSQFTSQELQIINRMQQDPNLYKNLASSVAPTVSGSDEIKKGLLLMMFGGVHKKTMEGTSLRGDLNVCILGDPSTAKSQFLKYVSNFLPRSVYTSGKSSSAAGLTASVQRDPETGEYCVEAGALMLADHGVCCIDEFDKMGLGDQVAIHEAMEQQTISIAKAGIQATLNARASILAAANPIQGRYDKSKTLKQNIEMSDPIMSRFDLFFVVLDDQNPQGDKTIANYILNLHQKGEDSLKDSYFYSKEEMQLYLKFCRYIKPVMTHEAAKELESSYISLRMADLTSQKSAYKITVRQLESLIRLSEALARVHGSLQITPAYVKEACQLLNQSIIKIERPDQELELEEHIQNQQQQDNQTIAQEVLERKQQEEQKRQNTIRLTYEQYISMVQDFVQWFRDFQEQQETRNQQQQEQGEQQDIEYGVRAAFAVEKYVERHLNDYEDDSEENIRSVINVCHSVLQKMIHVENILIVVDDNQDYKERILALHDNYAE